MQTAVTANHCSNYTHTSFFIADYEKLQKRSVAMVM